MFVHYCSSDTWSGTRAADEETGGYIFHGRHVFEVRLGVVVGEYLLKLQTKVCKDFIITDFLVYS